MPNRVIESDDAVALATRWFLEGRPVDMRALADAMAVGRATLYRVVGSQERLLGDVMIGLATEIMTASFDRARARGLAPGVDLIVGAARHLNTAIVRARPLRTFLAREPDLAFRVLFMPAARVHLRNVAAWQAVLQEAVDSGELELKVEPERLAYMFVRIGESMIYADLLADREPDLELAADLQRHLLMTSPPGG
ncbi:hypothetical protein CLV56_2016 [Mumia flava]|uniref:QsdR TetR regulatory C-terminal domain-containing protein n=1 Tax=Mumia flava TaxID=1348852 RepID=A0A2M9BIJ8_9ACTN|nr:QsdR family transcriptional regulator [Mumia flava]PJJ57778.1 hypothetical protein CLV56_2016 [Mumia flava]